ncbi:hypothetical protein [Natronomonas sp.]|uniref:DUF7261 family protein n=1 Tax=Natronomonas sp. TaxID=2184060 RepID=UPI0039896823
MARVERGQLVLVAAAVIAIALVPILFAYLQLGFHPDVAGAPAPSGVEAESFLDRSTHDAAAATAGEYDWSQRSEMAAAVRDAIGNDIETLETTRLEEGVAYEVSYNDTAAAAWRSGNCERGDGRRFGACETDGGVVMQERAGEAVLLAVGFDVRVVGPRSEANLTLVIEVGG